jgi:hypothetical protein
MGGGAESGNIVELTGEEHFLAHQMLIRMYPSHVGLVHAAVMMSKQCAGNKAFGWLRRRKADVMRGNKLSVGVRASPEQRARMSEARRGNRYAYGNKNRLGKRHTDETRAKISKTKTLRALPNWWLGKTHTVEARAKMALAKRGKAYRKGAKHSTESRIKMAAAQRARRSTT